MRTKRSFINMVVGLGGQGIAIDLVFCQPDDFCAVPFSSTFRSERAVYQSAWNTFSGQISEWYSDGIQHVPNRLLRMTEI